MSSGRCRPCSLYSQVCRFATSTCSQESAGFTPRSPGWGGGLACELDPAARAVYQRNWLSDKPTTPFPLDVELLAAGPWAYGQYDVLAAGFPCQPFSKSGKQQGMDEARGTLFWSILKFWKRLAPRWCYLKTFGISRAPDTAKTAASSLGTYEISDISSLTLLEFFLRTCSRRKKVELHSIVSGCLSRVCSSGRNAPGLRQAMSRPYRTSRWEIGTQRIGNFGSSWQPSGPGMLSTGGRRPLRQTRSSPSTSGTNLSSASGRTEVACLDSRFGPIVSESDLSFLLMRHFGSATSCGRTARTIRATGAKSEHGLSQVVSGNCSPVGENSNGRLVSRAVSGRRSSTSVHQGFELVHSRTFRPWWPWPRPVSSGLNAVALLRKRPLLCRAFLTTLTLVANLTPSPTGNWVTLLRSVPFSTSSRSSCAPTPLTSQRAWMTPFWVIAAADRYGRSR